MKSIYLRLLSQDSYILVTIYMYLSFNFCCIILFRFVLTCCTLILKSTYIHRIAVLKVRHESKGDIHSTLCLRITEIYWFAATYKHLWKWTQYARSCLSTKRQRLAHHRKGRHRLAVYTAPFLECLVSVIEGNAGNNTCATATYLPGPCECFYPWLISKIWFQEIGNIAGVCGIRF